MIITSSHALFRSRRRASRTTSWSSSAAPRPAPPPPSSSGGLRVVGTIHFDYQPRKKIYSVLILIITVETLTYPRWGINISDSAKRFDYRPGSFENIWSGLDYNLIDDFWSERECSLIDDTIAVARTTRCWTRWSDRCTTRSASSEGEQRAL